MEYTPVLRLSRKKKAFQTLSGSRGSLYLAVTAIYLLFLGNFRLDSSSDDPSALVQREISVPVNASTCPQGCWHRRKVRALAGSRFPVTCSALPARLNVKSCKRSTRGFTFHSEGMQDKYLMDNFFGGKCGGSFVELGSLDGIGGSNILTLEESMEWRGLCIEPNPTLYERLNRNRPKCSKVNGLVSSKSGTDSYVVTTDVGYNGIKSTIDFDKLKNAKVQVVETIDIQAFKLQDLVSRLGTAHIDVLSLDVEGGELAVLETIDFSKTTFGVLLVEGGWDERIVDLLAANGYQLADLIWWDAVFVNPCLYKYKLI